MKKAPKKIDGKTLFAALSRKIPANKLSLAPDALAAASRDQTECPESMPDLIARPTEAEEVRAIARFANEMKVPLTPRVAGTNLGGLTIPVKGGVVVDFTDMNRILEVNEDDMYMVVEPGVTYGQIKEKLDGGGLPFVIGYPLAPPYASALANCLMGGLLNMSLKHDHAAAWLNGLEVVLPSGEIVRTGSWALSDYAFSRVPLPDLTGLFVGWHGTTGMVVKGAMQIWPRPKFRKRLFALAYDRNSTFEMMREFSRLQFCEDIGGLSWPTAKLLFGVTSPGKKDPDEPEIYSYLDLAAMDRRELEWKVGMVEKGMRRLRNKGHKFEKPMDMNDLLKVDSRLGKFADFPMTLDFLLDHPGGGLTWVGTYGPLSRFGRGADAGVAIQEKHGFPPTMVLRSMRGGHYGVLRFIEVFKRDDPADVRRVTACQKDLCDALLDEGFIPYKTPEWAVKKFLKRMDPNFYKLMKTMKKTLDPNGVLAPGRWLF